MPRTMPAFSEHYVLLVRGVNVGTGNALPMAELRAMVERAGGRRVRTYVQSGNVVFESSSDPGSLRDAVEAALAGYMGRPIATTIRTRSEMRAIAEANPFAGEDVDPAKQCVTFLSEPPSAAELRSLAPGGFAPDRFVVLGRELHSVHPNGQGKSKLSAALAKWKVRGTVTTRNWKTIRQLVAVLDEG